MENRNPEITYMVQVIDELQKKYNDLKDEYEIFKKDASEGYLEVLAHSERLEDKVTGYEKGTLNDFDQYQSLCAAKATYPGCTEPGTVLGLAYCALGLGESGEAQGKVKKVLRDHNGVVTEELKKGIILELGDTLWYISECARQLGVTLSQVANANVEKLADRKERGVIKGEGDYR